MIGELYRSCPACSSKNLLNKGKPLDSSAGSPYSVIECLDCKLNWCSPMPTVKELNEYYNRYYEIRYSTVDKNPKIAKIRSILTFRKNRLRMFFNLIEKYSPVRALLISGVVRLMFYMKQKAGVGKFLVSIIQMSFRRGLRGTMLNLFVLTLSTQPELMNTLSTAFQRSMLLNTFRKLKTSCSRSESILNQMEYLL